MDLDSKTKSTTRQKGRLSEELALKFLLSKRFTLIERNYTVKGGEIDLIMRSDGFIVFVEVKSLSIFSEYSIYNAISRRKKYFLKKAIDKWLLMNNKKNHPWRCDSISIITNPGEKSLIEHFEFISLY
jgi:putative endonuclease